MNKVYIRSYLKWYRPVIWVLIPLKDAIFLKRPPVTEQEPTLVLLMSILQIKKTQQFIIQTVYLCSYLLNLKEPARMSGIFKLLARFTNSGISTRQTIKEKTFLVIVLCNNYFLANLPSSSMK